MDLLAFLSKTVELRRNARRDRAALEAAQTAKLRRLAAHAYARSPWYRDAMRARGIDAATCRVEQFPVLAKAQVVEHFDAIVTDPRATRSRVRDFLARSTDPAERMDGRFRVLHTSGSSGEVGVYVYGPDDWARGLAQFSRLGLLGARRRRVAYFGAVDGHFAGVSLAVSGSAGLPHLLYDTLACDINRPLARTIERLDAYRPHVLAGYATGLAILAQAQREGRLHVRPEAIHSGGEPLGPHERARIAESFGAPCVNVYATTEHLVMGASAPDGEGLVLFEDDLIFEPRADCTIVTNLFNFTLPLIRYRMDDVMAPIPPTDPRSPSRRIRDVVGRAETTPWFRNETGALDFVNPIVVAEIYVPGVRRFRMEVLDERSFVLRYCTDPGLAPDARRAAREGLAARLAAILSAKRMANVRFELAEAQDLPVDARTGKFRLIAGRAAGPVAGAP